MPMAQSNYQDKREPESVDKASSVEHPRTQKSNFTRMDHVVYGYDI